MMAESPQKEFFMASNSSALGQENSASPISNPKQPSTVKAQQPQTNLFHRSIDLTTSTQSLQQQPPLMMSPQKSQDKSLQQRDQSKLRSSANYSTPDINVLKQQQTSGNRINTDMGIVNAPNSDSKNPMINSSNNLIGPHHQHNNSGLQSNQKQMNSFFNENSRRFSIFSQTSMATSNSFMFGTRCSMNATQQACPQVNIGNIIKQQAVLYLDESLANTFDDLLEKGYTIVSSKKQERDIYKSQESGMKEQIYQMEREIVPLINQMNQLQDNIDQQQKLETQYNQEIESLQLEITDFESKTQNRIREIQELHQKFNEEIKLRETENNNIKTAININQTNHQMDKSEMDKISKRNEAELDQLVVKLNQLQVIAEEQRLSQADKLRQMGNQSKMFIGILKH